MNIELTNDSNDIEVKDEVGHCAECGKITHRYDKNWDWYICEEHNSLDVARDLYNHVMNPND